MTADRAALRQTVRDALADCFSDSAWDKAIWRQVSAAFDGAWPEAAPNVEGDRAALRERLLEMAQAWQSGKVDRRKRLAHDWADAVSAALVEAAATLALPASEGAQQTEETNNQ
jgi:hypothetical protein